MWLLWPQQAQGLRTQGPGHSHPYIGAEASDAVTKDFGLAGLRPWLPQGLSYLGQVLVRGARCGFKRSLVWKFILPRRSVGVLIIFFT